MSFFGNDIDCSEEILNNIRTFEEKLEELSRDICLKLKNIFEYSYERFNTKAKKVSFEIKKSEKLNKRHKKLMGLDSLVIQYDNLNELAINLYEFLFINDHILEITKLENILTSESYMTLLNVTTVFNIFLYYVKANLKTKYRKINKDFETILNNPYYLNMIIYKVQGKICVRTKDMPMPDLYYNDVKLISKKSLQSRKINEILKFIDSSIELKEESEDYFKLVKTLINSAYDFVIFYDNLLEMFKDESGKGCAVIDYNSNTNITNVTLEHYSSLSFVEKNMKKVKMINYIVREDPYDFSSIETDEFEKELREVFESSNDNSDELVYKSKDDFKTIFYFLRKIQIKYRIAFWINKKSVDGVYVIHIVNTSELNELTERTNRLSSESAITRTHKSVEKSNSSSKRNMDISNKEAIKLKIESENYFVKIDVPGDGFCGTHIIIIIYLLLMVKYSDSMNLLCMIPLNIIKNLINEIETNSRHVDDSYDGNYITYSTVQETLLKITGLGLPFLVNDQMIYTGSDEDLDFVEIVGKLENEHFQVILMNDFSKNWGNNNHFLYKLTFHRFLLNKVTYISSADYEDIFNKILDYTYGVHNRSRTISEDLTRIFKTPLNVEELINKFYVKDMSNIFDKKMMYLSVREIIKKQYRNYFDDLEVIVIDSRDDLNKSKIDFIKSNKSLFENNSIVIEEHGDSITFCFRNIKLENKMDFKTIKENYEVINDLAHKMSSVSYRFPHSVNIMNLTGYKFRKIEVNGHMFEVINSLLGSEVILHQTRIHPNSFINNMEVVFIDFSEIEKYEKTLLPLLNYFFESGDFDSDVLDVIYSKLGIFDKEIKKTFELEYKNFKTDNIIEEVEYDDEMNVIRIDDSESESSHESSDSFSNSSKSSDKNENRFETIKSIFTDVDESVKKTVDETINNYDEQIDHHSETSKTDSMNNNDLDQYFSRNNLDLVYLSSENLNEQFITVWEQQTTGYKSLNEVLEFFNDAMSFIILDYPELNENSVFILPNKVPRTTIFVHYDNKFAILNFVGPKIKNIKTEEEIVRQIEYSQKLMINRLMRNPRLNYEQLLEMGVDPDTIRKDKKTFFEDFKKELEFELNSQNEREDAFDEDIAIFVDCPNDCWHLRSNYIVNLKKTNFKQFLKEIIMHKSMENEVNVMSESLIEITHCISTALRTSEKYTNIDEVPSKYDNVFVWISPDFTHMSSEIIKDGYFNKISALRKLFPGKNFFSNEFELDDENEPDVVSIYEEFNNEVQNIEFILHEELLNKTIEISKNYLNVLKNSDNTVDISLEIFKINQYVKMLIQIVQWIQSGKETGRLRTILNDIEHFCRNLYHIRIEAMIDVVNDLFVLIEDFDNDFRQQLMLKLAISAQLKMSERDANYFESSNLVIHSDKIENQYIFFDTNVYFHNLSDINVVLTKKIIIPYVIIVELRRLIFHDNIDFLSSFLSFLKKNEFVVIGDRNNKKTGDDRIAEDLETFMKSNKDSSLDFVTHDNRFLVHMSNVRIDHVFIMNTVAFLNNRSNYIDNTTNLNLMNNPDAASESFYKYTNYSEFIYDSDRQLKTTKENELAMIFDIPIIGDNDFLIPRFAEITELKANSDLDTSDIQIKYSMMINFDEVEDVDNNYLLNLGNQMIQTEKVFEDTKKIDLNSINLMNNVEESLKEKLVTINESRKQRETNYKTFNEATLINLNDKNRPDYQYRRSSKIFIDDVKSEFLVSHMGGLNYFHDISEKRKRNKKLRKINNVHNIEQLFVLESHYVKTKFENDNRNDLKYYIGDYNFYEESFDEKEIELIGTHQIMNSLQNIVDSNNIKDKEFRELKLFSDLFNGLIEDSHKARFLNENEFIISAYVKNIGFIIPSQKPKTTVKTSVKYRMFFFLEDDELIHGFNPEIVLDTSDTNKKLYISRQYMVDMSIIIYRSRLYDTTYFLRQVCNDYNKFYWTLFFPSTATKSLLSFFKFFNIIAHSDRSKFKNLCKKYLYVVPKRATDIWLIHRVELCMKKLLLGEPSSLLNFNEENIQDLLEHNNLYTYCYNETTTSVHNYQKFYDDIKKNIKSKKEFTLDGVFTDQMSDKKHINLRLLKESMKYYKTNHNVFLDNQEFVRFINDEFHSFFFTTTNGLDPYTLRKAKNTIIFHRCVYQFMKEKNCDLSPVGFVKYCLEKTEKRGALSAISIKYQKDVSDREIVIQDIFTKGSHFFIQMVFKYLNLRWPQELVTKSEVEKYKTISSMGFDNTSMFINDDMQKWSSQDIKLKFILVGDLLYKNNIISEDVYKLLRKSFEVTYDIYLIFDKRLKNDNLDYYDSKDLVNNIKNVEILRKVSPKTVNEGKGLYYHVLHMSHGWPQGIYHFVSSFVHGLCSLVTQKIMTLTIPKIKSVSIIFHSDDKNTVIKRKGDKKFSEAEADNIMKLNMLIPLSFSLAQSLTKPSSVFTESNVKIGNKSVGRMSEMVSVYNVESVIFNSYFRQTASIFTSLNKNNFIENHYEIIGRICTLFSLSNKVIESERAYSYFFKRLSELYNRDSRFDSNLISWGGSKSIPIYLLTQYGLKLDNYQKYRDNNYLIYNQIRNPLNILETNIDYKSKKQSELEITVKRMNTAIDQNISEDVRNSIIETVDYYSKRILSNSSGNFISERESVLYNFYRSRNIGVYIDFDTLKDIKENRFDITTNDKGVFNILPAKKFTWEIELNLKTLNDIDSLYKENYEPKLDEFSIGDASTKEEFDEALYLYDTAEPTLSTSQKLYGYIKRMKMRFGDSFNTPFNRVIELLTNTVDTFLKFYSLTDYNSTVSDLTYFTDKYKISKVKHLLESRHIWDLETKISKVRSPILTLFKDSNEFTDVVLSSKKHFLLDQIKKEKFHVSIMKRKMQGFGLIKALSEQIDKSVNNSVYNFMINHRRVLEPSNLQKNIQLNAYDLITDDLLTMSRNLIDHHQTILMRELNDTLSKMLMSLYLSRPIHYKSFESQEIFIDAEKDVTIFAIMNEDKFIGRAMITGDRVEFDYTVDDTNISKFTRRHRVRVDPKLDALKKDYADVTFNHGTVTGVTLNLNKNFIGRIEVFSSAGSIDEYHSYSFLLNLSKSNKKNVLDRSGILLETQFPKYLQDFRNVKIKDSNIANSLKTDYETFEHILENCKRAIMVKNRLNKICGLKLTTCSLQNCSGHRSHEEIICESSLRIYSNSVTEYRYDSIVEKTVPSNFNNEMLIINQRSIKKQIRDIQINFDWNETLYNSLNNSRGENLSYTDLLNIFEDRLSNVNVRIILSMIENPNMTLLFNKDFSKYLYFFNDLPNVFNTKNIDSAKKNFERFGDDAESANWYFSWVKKDLMEICKSVGDTQIISVDVDLHTGSMFDAILTDSKYQYDKNQYNEILRLLQTQVELGVIYQESDKKIIKDLLEKIKNHKKGKIQLPGTIKQALQFFKKYSITPPVNIKDITKARLRMASLGLGDKMIYFDNKYDLCMFFTCDTELGFDHQELFVSRFFNYTEDISITDKELEKEIKTADYYFSHYSEGRTSYEDVDLPEDEQFEQKIQVENRLNEILIRAYKKIDFDDDIIVDPEAYNQISIGEDRIQFYNELTGVEWFMLENGMIPAEKMPYTKNSNNKTHIIESNVMKERLEGLKIELTRLENDLKKSQEKIIEVNKGMGYDELLRAIPEVPRRNLEKYISLSELVSKKDIKSFEEIIEIVSKSDFRMSKILETRFRTLNDRPVSSRGFLRDIPRFFFHNEVMDLTINNDKRIQAFSLKLLNKTINDSDKTKINTDIFRKCRNSVIQALIVCSRLTDRDFIKMTEEFSENDLFEYDDIMTMLRDGQQGDNDFFNILRKAIEVINI